MVLEVVHEEINLVDRPAQDKEAGNQRQGFDDVVSSVDHALFSFLGSCSSTTAVPCRIDIPVKCASDPGIGKHQENQRHKVVSSDDEYSNENLDPSGWEIRINRAVASADDTRCRRHVPRNENQTDEPSGSHDDDIEDLVSGELCLVVERMDERQKSLECQDDYAVAGWHEQTPERDLRVPDSAEDLVRDAAGGTFRGVIIFECGRSE